MSRREELLAHLWKHVINISARDSSLDNIIANAGATLTVRLATLDRQSSECSLREPGGVTCAWFFVPLLMQLSLVRSTR
jgi:hypothetical protein